MANNNSAINPYYSAAPIAATGNPTDFDVQAAELARRRRMAELLQQQSMQPMSFHGGRGSLLQPIAQMIQAWAGKSSLDDLGKQEQDLSGQRSQALSKLIREYPQGTPEQPAIPAQDLSGEGDANVGMNQVPMIPGQAAKPATPEQMIPWALDMGQTGGKYGQDVAKIFLNAAEKRAAPEASPYVVAGGSVFNKKTGKWEAGSPEVLAKQEETRVNNMARLQQAADAAKQRSEDTRLGIEQRRDAASQAADLRRELAADRKEAGGNSGVMNRVGVTEDTGEAVVANNKSGGQYIVKTNDDGSVTHTPYNGNVIPTAQNEKNVSAVQTQSMNISQAKKSIDDLTKNPKSYGSVSALASTVLPDVAVTSLLTEDQKMTRAEIARQSAEIVKPLYGAAFTLSEQKRADSFIVKPTDSIETALAKLKSGMKFAEDMKAKYGTAANRNADTRTSGNAPKTVTVNY